MKTARIYEYGKDLVIEDVEEPKLDENGVIVKIEGAGFCHSDLHIIDGEIKILPKLPMTLGHENAGIVYKVGKNVKDLKEGDKVVVYGGWGCGYCDFCIKGEENLCIRPNWVGILNDGGYAEYLYVPHERYLVRIDKLEPKIACIYADAGLTPYRAYKKIRHLLDGESYVLIIGCGGLGQFGVKIIKALTPSKVIAVDINDEKLNKAKEYGADIIINSNKENPLTKIMEITNNLGVDASLDFVGSNETLNLSVVSTKVGGKVVQIGLAGGSANLKILENIRFEVSFEFSLWGNIKELRELLSLAENNIITPIDVEFYKLEDINRLIENLKENKIRGRAIVIP